MGTSRMSILSTMTDCGALLGALARATGLTTCPWVSFAPTCYGFACRVGLGSPIPRVKLPRNLSGGQFGGEESRNPRALKV